MIDKTKLKKVELGEGSGAEVWDFEKDGKEIGGTYVLMQTNVGPNNSNMYIIRQENGTDRAVWGSTGIDMQMKHIQTGATVLIEFEGMKQHPESKRYYKKFNVYYDAPDNPDNPVDAKRTRERDEINAEIGAEMEKEDAERQLSADDFLG